MKEILHLLHLNNNDSMRFPPTPQFAICFTTHISHPARKDSNKRRERNHTIYIINENYSLLSFVVSPQEFPTMLTSSQVAPIAKPSS